MARQDRFLERYEDADGLLPTDGYGVPTVWIDHHGFAAQPDKAAALNLYYAGYLREGVARIARWLGDGTVARRAERRAERVLVGVRSRYWDAERELFVDNLPRLARDGPRRLHDRTLALAVLFGALSDGEVQVSAEVLANRPPELGRSYPCNAPWRLWALGRAGRIDAVLHELRTEWAIMNSARLSGVFGEAWVSQPGGWNAWGQCAVAPILALSGELLGVRPTAPGFAEAELRPQLGDLAWLRGEVPTPRGPIRLSLSRDGSGRRLAFSLPAGVQAWVVLERGLKSKGALTAPTPGEWPGTQMWPVAEGEHLWQLMPRGDASCQRARGVRRAARKRSSQAAFLRLPLRLPLVGSSLSRLRASWRSTAMFSGP